MLPDNLNYALAITLCIHQMWFWIRAFEGGGQPQGVKAVANTMHTRIHVLSHLLYIDTLGQYSKQQKEYHYTSNMAIVGLYLNKKFCVMVKILMEIGTSIQSLIILGWWQWTSLNCMFKISNRPLKNVSNCTVPIHLLHLLIFCCFSFNQSMFHEFIYVWSELLIFDCLNYSTQLAIDGF